MKVLFIGDDQQISTDVTFVLQVKYRDVKTVCARSIAEASELVASGPDLIILDSANIGENTPGWITEIRRIYEAPLLVLSHGETDIDRARGLEAGADEYITKPFTAIELLARCNALVRRSRQNPGDTISFNGLDIDFSTREVFLSNKRVRLTPIEYGLLSELARGNGHVVSQDDLLAKVWGPEYIGGYYLVKTYIYRLRSKLDLLSKEQQLIHNVRGFGYRLNRGEP